MLADEVMRQELARDGIAVSLLLPSITATEFGDGMFTLGASPRPGMVAHSPDYVAGVILRLLRTGEDTLRHPARPGAARAGRHQRLSVRASPTWSSSAVTTWAPEVRGNRSGV